MDIYVSSTGDCSVARLAQPRYSPTPATVGTQALFAGGYRDSAHASDVVDEYDPATGRWATMHLSAARAEIASATLGNRVLFAGGCVPRGIRQPYTPSSMVDVYDATTRAWSTAMLSVARADLAVAQVDDQALFIGGMIPCRSCGFASLFGPILDIYSAS